jgi:hypothetical protein
MKELVMELRVELKVKLVDMIVEKFRVKLFGMMLRMMAGKIAEIAG